MDTNFKNMGQELNELMDEAIKMVIDMAGLENLADIADDEESMKTFILSMKAIKLGKRMTTETCDWYDNTTDKINNIENKMAKIEENQTRIEGKMNTLGYKLDKMIKKLDSTRES